MALAWLLSHLKFKTIMKGIRFLAAAAAAVICLSGCVSNKKYNKLQMEYQTTRDGLLECNSNSKGMEYVIKDLRSQNDDLKKQQIGRASCRERVF